MRSVVACLAGSSALVALLFTASCLEPDRSNGEPCLSEDQCESNYCRAGVCATPPDTHPESSLPPPVDAATDVTEDAEEAAPPNDATPDVTADVTEDAADDATEDVTEDAADAAEDADDDAQDAQND